MDATGISPTGRFAVIRSGYAGLDAAQWSVFEIGRETAKRVYQQVVKPSSRWQDIQRDKDSIVARFDTREAAVDFCQALIPEWKRLSEPVERIDGEIGVLRLRLREASDSRQDQMTAAIAKAIGANS